LANLKVRVGIVSSDPKDRAVRMVRAFDKAIQSITANDLVITVGYVGTEFRLKVSWSGRETQLNHLPDGLRAIVGWLASVVCKLDALLPDVENPLEQPLILLLDEPDAYLHPAWQRKLIPAVQHLLPNAQIFVATHSPFVISSVNAGWIYIFEADSAGKVTIKPPILCSQGDSYIDVVEDILGVKERFDPETEDRLREFRTKRDALKRQPTDEAFKELQSLAATIAKRGQTLEFMMGREMAQLDAQLLQAQSA
jgi:predicted ATP-binding protein involved in virulence